MTGFGAWLSYFAFGSGTSGSTTQRVILASNDPAVTALQSLLLGRATAVYRLLTSLATTNGANIKNAAGTIYGLECINHSASIRYLKLYNKATAPVVGTDVPIYTHEIPPNGKDNLDILEGLYFATGIGIAITGVAADNDTTAIAANDITSLNLRYA